MKDKKPGGYSFVFFSVVTAAITAAIILLNTYSALQSQLVLADAQKNSSELSQGLFDIQEHYIRSAESVARYLPDSGNPLNDEEYLERLVMLINAVSTDFSQQREIVLGYYYYINAGSSAEHLQVFHNVETDVQSHISMILGYMTDRERTAIEEQISRTGQPLWLTLNQPIHNKYYLSCVVPLFANGEYIGFAGIVVDSAVLKQQYADMRADSWRYSFLLSASNEIFAHERYAGGERLEYVDSKYLMPLAEKIGQSDSGYAVVNEPGGSEVWIYAFSKMPSGHIYVEAQQRAHRVTGTNLILLQMALVSIIATSLVSRRRSGTESIFESISRRVIRISDDVHPMTKSAYRAMLALHIGCLGGTGFRLLYMLFSGDAAWQIAIYIALMAGLLLALLLYRFDRLSNAMLTMLSISALLMPVALQIIESTPGEMRTTGNLIWILTAVVGALFLVGRHKARNVFYAFIILLFAYILIEIFVMGYPHPEVLLPIIGSLIFLGFALFSSLSIYVQHAKANYNMVELTLKELTDTQSMLVQHEKMVTLGRLVAGVAHEINTPLGAIKATADTLCASTGRVFKSLAEQSKDFNDKDRDDLLTLINMVSESVKQMNATSQLRKARAAIRAFAQEILPEKGPEIAEILIRLEICDIELLRANTDALSNPKALQILQLICDISPFIVGSQTIEYAAVKAGKIIFALKSYSHSGASGESAPFDIMQSVETVLTLYQNQLKQNIQVERHFDEPLPNVVGVADEIGQVWTNIIHNAIQAMPAGGTLSISLRDTLDGFVEAEFADTGTGIPEENFKLIFEPFFTTKHIGEGTGLGLDISKKIVRRHGGVIEVQNGSEKGAVFIVRLPTEKNDNVRDYRHAGANGGEEKV